MKCIAMQKNREKIIIVWHYGCLMKSRRNALLPCNGINILMNFMTSEAFHKGS